MSNILVCGAGGFIGGHLVRKFMSEGHNLVCADFKPFEYWCQFFEENTNHCVDLREKENTDLVTKNIDYVFNMACNMGGMGFIENNKTDCMLSVLINTNMCRSSLSNKVKKYFFSSSACVYNASKQSKVFIEALKESDAYPADPEDGYGWEKLFNERMCRHFYEDFGLEVRIARYHNIYGEYGSWKGGREKAPAAMARKFVEGIKYNKKDIEIWGDGNQIRSFLYIDDCVKATDLLFKSKYRNPINIGSDKHVSINKLVTILEKISGIKFKRKYDLSKPQGVKSRSSDNTLVKKTLNWSPQVSIEDGMEKIFRHIQNEYVR